MNHQQPNLATLRPDVMTALERLRDTLETIPSEEMQRRYNRYLELNCYKDEALAA